MEARVSTKSTTHQMRTITSLISGLLLLATLHMASAADTVVASGSWTKKTAKISGTWSIVDDGKTKTIHLKGFSTKKAPDLKLFLSPQTAKAATNKNATTGSALIIKLKSHKGDQSYTLPASADPSKFKSILIHCEKYTKLWGAANLKK